MSYYTITFNTTSGRRSLRINNPTVGLSDNDIDDAIEQLMDNDVFNPEKGAIESLSKMDLVTIDRIALR